MNPSSHAASPTTTTMPGRRLIRAAAIADATGLFAAPGTILVEGGRILAAGTPQSVGMASAAVVEEHPQSLVIPALVNAHAHLDLTQIGPQPFDGKAGGFTRWVEMVRARRATLPQDIAASVREGVRLSRAGGTALVGDIAGARSTTPATAMRDAGMGGVSYIEIFGIGRMQGASISAMQAAVQSLPALERGVRVGVQPHAPYSCGPDVYRAAAMLGRPLATHLAETQDELAFVAHGTGPLADMLRCIGVWDESIAGVGSHPIDLIAQLWGTAPFVAAHLNYIEDRHLEVLARLRMTVAYCPRASAYFGHPPGHRYREMLEAGVNVALGTDSIICLGTAERISVLDEMRFLHERDAAAPLALLGMGTLNGARALGVRQSLFRIAPGESAGLLSLQIDPTNAQGALSQALRRIEAPRWLAGPVVARDDWFES